MKNRIAGISLYGGCCLLESSVGAAAHGAFHVYLPAGPGIGVILDEARLRRYARS